MTFRGFLLSSFVGQKTNILAIQGLDHGFHDQPKRHRDDKPGNDGSLDRVQRILHFFTPSIIRFVFFFVQRTISTPRHVACGRHEEQHGNGQHGVRP